jgi:beta-glucosidase
LSTTREPELGLQKQEKVRFVLGFAGEFATLLGLSLAFAVCLMPAKAQQAVQGADANALYKQRGVHIEQRIDDLLQRMTLEEKARQLDLYAAAGTLEDKHTGKDHVALDAAFLPDKAKAMWGTLGVGGIHDTYPTSVQSNAIQSWVIANNRLGIPALFVEEGLHGFDTGTVFPAPVNLAATWNPVIAQRTGAAIAAEARSTGVGMILAPVLDLAREPRWGRVEEDFGEDPYLTGQFGLAYVRGMQGESLCRARFTGRRHEYISCAYGRARVTHGHAARI